MTRWVWGPTELSETALNQYSINHLTILTTHFHCGVLVSSMLLSCNACKITMFSVLWHTMTVVNAHGCLWGRLGI